MDERQILWVFYFLLGIIVLTVLLGYVNSVVIGTNFDKNYLVRDVALMLNTVYFSPGKINLEYSYDNSYNLYINNEFVGIYNGVELKYPYYKKENIDIFVERGILKIREK